jgi:hypothetical protein
MVGVFAIAVGLGIYATVVTGALAWAVCGPWVGCLRALLTSLCSCVSRIRRCCAPSVSGDHDKLNVPLNDPDTDDGFPPHSEQSGIRSTSAAALPLDAIELEVRQ